MPARVLKHVAIRWCARAAQLLPRPAMPMGGCGSRVHDVGARAARRIPAASGPLPSPLVRRLAAPPSLLPRPDRCDALTNLAKPLVCRRQLVVYRRVPVLKGAVITSPRP